MGSNMIDAAMEIGYQLGVNFKGGTPVKASGNCLIESIKGNIDERDIFKVKLKETTIELRINSAVEGEKVIGCSPYRIEDYDDVMWAQGWSQLKVEGIWDVEYFGDLMIIALAHYIHKNILLINTDPESPIITVILGDQFGIKLDSDFPVILGYSGNHYESLIPITLNDEEGVKDLICKYVNGEQIIKTLDNTTNSDKPFNVKINIIETIKDLPNFSINDWDPAKSDSKSSFKSINVQSLVSKSAPSQDQSLWSKNNNNDNSQGKESAELLGLDNWQHCHPSKDSKFSSTTNSSWETESTVVSIPIIRVESDPKLKIPINRGPSNYVGNSRELWED